MRLVVVKFLDPTTHNDWCPVGEVLLTEPTLCVVAGVLVTERNKMLKLALLSAEDKEGTKISYASWIDIPTSCIVSRGEFEVDGGEETSG